MTRIAICDDEISIASSLKDQVEKFFHEGEHTAEVSTFSSAEAFLFEYTENSAYDILLLDVEMKNMDGIQLAKTDFTVELNGENSSANVISRSVAKDKSHQIFLSNIKGNNKCAGHTECDAIIMDEATVSAIPEITANHIDAALIHEAAIGKIAGEQLIKLMTLGLTESEAEEQIVSGFLK